MERRLVFKTIDHPAGKPNGQGLRETLLLDNPYAKTYRLTRVLTQSCGLEARLEVEGTNPVDLLAQIEAIPLQRQFVSGPGFGIAQSHQLQDSLGEPLVRMVLTHGVLKVDGLTVILKPSGVKNFAADIELITAPGDKIDLPEDLLAVLGWGWSPIRRDKEGWRSKMRMKGKQPGCSRTAEAKLAQVAAHLAQTLADPPRYFHQRFVLARWGVVFRRAIPVLTALGLLCSSLIMAQFDIEYAPSVQMILMNSPALLLVFAFSLQEMPRFEFPPLPKPPTALAWR